MYPPLKYIRKRRIDSYTLPVFVDEWGGILFCINNQGDPNHIRINRAGWSNNSELYIVDGKRSQRCTYAKFCAAGFPSESMGYLPLSILSFL